MAFDSVQTGTTSGPHHQPRLRREAREEAVRIVEYTPFPRRSGLERPRVGFTRDFSPSGMCLGVDARENVGSLLRVTLRDVDGSTSRTAIERVVWCTEERDGRFWIGLELLGDSGAQAPTLGRSA